MDARDPNDPKLSFFGLDREFQAYQREYLRCIEEVLASGQLLQSHHVTALEARLARMNHRQFAVAVNSCTDGLYFALRAAGIHPGDEVLVSTWSFVASASCICRAGAVPVFVDVDHTYHMDLQRAAAAITPRTRGLIVVHLYGLMADPLPVEAFAKAHDLILIEDAAQALGASHQEVPAGSLGMASCLSFDPTKVLGAPGCGGMVLTDHADIATRVRRQRYHGKGPEGWFGEFGVNSQMSALTASLLDRKLEYQPEWLSRRRAIADAYFGGLSDLAPKLVLPKEEPGTAHIYHKFVLRTSRRDALRAHLDAAGIPTLIHYPNPLHQQPCFRELRRWEDKNYPNACAFAQAVLSLPIHPFLRQHEVGRIIEQIQQFFGQAQTRSRLNAGWMDTARSKDATASTRFD
jgi:dTDP-4-amino-4,6-dideoxygalactose transaminase